MSVELKDVETQALQLSGEDKEILIERLLGSLEGDVSRDIERAWLEEAARRYEEYKAGRSQGVPGEKIFDEIRRELGWRS